METPYRLELFNNMSKILPAHCRTRSRILFSYIVLTLPWVKKILRYWETEALMCSDPHLKKQALASLHQKAFHCYGGAVYAVGCGHLGNTTLRLIVAYQTICDYLDNLCDRAGSTDGKAFAKLHHSLIDALTPGNDIGDYYAYYPYCNDSGYLVKLVNECRSCVRLLPAYDTVYSDVTKLAWWYIELQVKKHLALDSREQILRDWVEKKLVDYPEIRWQEFAAASGSTLAIFALFALAANGSINEEERENIIKTYFPWICGLHILLDYYIDQEEDSQGGDLNFTFYYSSQDEIIERLSYFIKQARDRVLLIPSCVFDNIVVEGLLAMYLSDKKVHKQGLSNQADTLLKLAEPGARQLYWLCRLVRKTLKFN
ncbi:MAG: tetraprenyl-beta-curcumene synthase family protein [Syntrophomonadaceae bacterium]|jgi:tetraprenyl-beta-curcumene synthase